MNNLEMKQHITTEELIKTQKEKDELLYTISHDLRAPITVINNAVNTLLSMDEIDQDTLYKTLTIIKRRGDYIHQLVEDVFLLTSVQTNPELLHLKALSINTFLTDYYHITSDPAYHSRRLGFHIPSDYTYIISMDSRLIQHVLNNLLSNALKLSSKGDTICLNAFESSNNTFTIQIINTGTGIPSEQIPLIFHRASTADTSTSPAQDKSCEIGLLLEQAILKKHKGFITCKSKEGKGSIFSITLPYIEKRELKRL